VSWYASCAAGLLRSEEYTQRYRPALQGWQFCSYPNNYAFLSLPICGSLLYSSANDNAGIELVIASRALKAMEN
jgi:hypothetical protein